MANVDNELIKRTLLIALENAIRYAHLNDDEYSAENYIQAYTVLMRKVYKSEEARNMYRLPTSVREGTDFGLTHTMARVISGKATAVQKMKKQIEAIS